MFYSIDASKGEIHLKFNEEPGMLYNDLWAVVRVQISLIVV